MDKQKFSIAAGALALALAATAAPQAHALAPVSGNAVARASFASTTARPANNLSWSVTAPVLTRAALGSRVTITASLPAGLDCRTVTLVDVSRRARLAPHSRACSSRSTTLSAVVTKQMVGHRVALSGWAAAGSRATVKVVAKVQVKGSQQAVTAAASRKPTTPGAPVLSGATTLGTVPAGVVQIGTLKGATTVLVGAKTYPTLSGTIWHSSLEGGRVDVWTKTATGLAQWHLDTGTGKVTSSTIATGEVLVEGRPGFWVRLDASRSGTGMPVKRLYAWSGAQRKQVNDIGITFKTVGFTDTAAVLLTGMASTSATLIPLDGSTEYTATTPAPIYRAVPDAKGVVLTYGTASTCRVDQGSTTCPGN